MYVKKEMMLERHPFISNGKAQKAQIHEVVFHIKQLNLDRLQQLVESRSCPDHQSYQQWLSFSEVNALTYNVDGVNVVLEWLKSNNVEVCHEKSSSVATEV